MASSLAFCWKKR